MEQEARPQADELLNWRWKSSKLSWRSGPELTQRKLLDSPKERSGTNLSLALTFQSVTARTCMPQLKETGEILEGKPREVLMGLTGLEGLHCCQGPEAKRSTTSLQMSSRKGLRIQKRNSLGKQVSIPCWTLLSVK